MDRNTGFFLLLILATIISTTVVEAHPQFPLLASPKKYCIFGGPTDAATLRNANFIENYASGQCLKQESYGFNLLQPISLDRCSWANRFPSKQHLFKIENQNSGSIIKPTTTSLSLSGRCMVAPTGSLSSNTCIPKSDEQTWIFQPVDRLRNLYLIMKKSNKKCLTLQSPKWKPSVVETRCNPQDKYQVWRICSSSV